MINDLVKTYKRSLQASEMNKSYLINGDGFTKKIIEEKITREKIILEALEKQIEIEPDWEAPTNDAKDDAEAYCPRCDYRLKDETNYCPDCGQKILWP